MRTLGIIPARYASTRFPGKPLANIHGKPMIRRVYEQAVLCGSLSDVIVATDDDRIRDTVIAFGGKVEMTSPNHASGTDRCAEVAARFPGYDVVVNIQGDEPYINPIQIQQVTELFANPDCEIATLVKIIDSPEELHNPNRPKVVLNAASKALYFSRHPIPYYKDCHPDEWHLKQRYFKHIGLYAYRSDVLRRIAALPQGSLEKAESLEQLRWLEAGYTIYASVTDIESQSVDLPEDIAHIKL